MVVLVRLRILSNKKTIDIDMHKLNMGKITAFDVYSIT